MFMNLPSNYLIFASIHITWQISRELSQLKLRWICKQCKTHSFYSTIKFAILFSKFWFSNKVRYCESPSNRSVRLTFKMWHLNSPINQLKIVGEVGWVNWQNYLLIKQMHSLFKGSTKEDIGYLIVANIKW